MKTGRVFYHGRSTFYFEWSQFSWRQADINIFVSGVTQREEAAGWV